MLLLEEACLALEHCIVEGKDLTERLVEAVQHQSGRGEFPVETAVLGGLEDSEILPAMVPRQPLIE